MNTVMLSLNRTTLNAEAERVARDKGFTSSDDIDAFRHALWQATLTQALGEGLAQDIGDWNEIIGDNDSESRNKDLFNNREGRDIGNEAKENNWTDDQLYEKIKEAIQSGRLISDEENDPRTNPANFDTSLTPLTIKVKDAVSDAYKNSQNWFPRRDPLTLDLDGDGLETTGVAATNPILFDHDGDGIKNGTGWVSSDDGFLVRDINGNGSIDSGRELFGDSTIKSNGQTATDGFDALADLDSMTNGGNADGKISNLDAQFTNLRIWRDLNQDGISQTGELFTLASLNIASINVASTANSQTLPNGNQIADLGTFTKTDGTTGTAGAVTGNLADVNLASDTFHRTFPDVLDTTSVATLPDMQGSGAVRDLREAATQSTTLQNLLTQFSAATTRTGQMALIDQLLDAWADTGGMAESMAQRVAGMAGFTKADGTVIPYTLSSNLTAEWTQKLHIVETFNGGYFFGLPNTTQTTGAVTGLTITTPTASSTSVQITANFNQQQLDLLQQSYDAIKRSVYDALALQTHLKPLLNQISLVIDSTGINLDFTQVSNTLNQAINSDTETGLLDLISFNYATRNMLKDTGWDGGAILMQALQAKQAIQSSAVSEMLKFYLANMGNGDSNYLFGTNDNDLLQGFSGHDTLYGGAGNDTLMGGNGNDTYYFNQGDGQDLIIDSGGDSGNKIIFGVGLLSTMSMSGAGNQEIVYTFGNGSDRVTISASSSPAVSAYFVSEGSALANAITGSVYNDHIYGFAGNDTITGNLGNDWLYGGDGDDVLNGYGLTDTSGAQLYGSDVGDFYIGGKGNDTLNGNTKNDTYYFNLGDGNDVISEGVNLDNGIVQASLDSLYFGAGIILEALKFSRLGNQLLIQVSATDSITINNWFTETDRVNNYHAYSNKYWVDGFYFNDGRYLHASTIMSSILTVHGTNGNDVMTGFASWDNVLYGEAGNDSLSGGNFDNQLYGGTGNDYLLGGERSDYYYFSQGDGNDTIYDTGGLDKVYFDASVTANDIALSRSVNDLVLTNTLTNETINISNYVSQVSFTFQFAHLGRYGIARPSYKVEDFVFANGSSLSTDAILQALDSLGTEDNDLLNGTALVNVLYGRYGNDTLYGLDGNDSLFGEDGDDQLYGGNGDDYIDAGWGSDLLVGGDGSDILLGDLGNDTLIGGAGTNHLVGGGGADSYHYNLGDGYDTIYDYTAPLLGLIDRIILGAGIDLTSLTFNRWNDDLDISLPSNGTITIKNHFYFNNYAAIERLELADGNSIGLTDLQISSGIITGSAADSTLIGSSTNDTLNGGAGNDWLDGKEGADRLVGGSGNDLYKVDNRSDVVTELINEGADTVFSSIAYTLGANVENLTLTGTAGINGKGNSLDNVFRGNSAANTFTGGIGNDTYYLSTGDSAVEATSAGIDVVYTDATYTMGSNIENAYIIGAAAVNLTGNALANIINGNAAANILNGSTGSDTLTGGLGDDTYVVDVATDIVTENANEGADTVQVGYATAVATTLTTGTGKFTNIENITVTGTGSYSLTGDVGNNILIGNASANVLIGNAGNDTMNGLAGNDTLLGGLGNDTYTIDVLTDVITENLNEGIDLVNVAIATRGGTYTLVANFENATLTNAVAYNLTGNILDNVLTGNGLANNITSGAGNDTLNGLAGSDTMVGGQGNDIYTIDVLTDVITENLNEGNDFVNVAIATAAGTYTVAANVESAKLINTVAYNLVGNLLNNQLIGNLANNILTGAAGTDVLTGGLGADTFDFNAIAESSVGTSRDIITDFNRMQLDKIDLSTIDANNTLANDQAFLSSILTSGAFTSIGQLRLVGDILSGNTDSNFATSEFEIQLTGVTSLAGTDFVL